VFFKLPLEPETEEEQDLQELENYEDLPESAEEATGPMEEMMYQPNDLPETSFVGSTVEEVAAATAASDNIKKN
jgi:hypothetical protein